MTDPTQKGVALNAPPARLLTDLHAQIDRAIATLPPGTNGALIGVATTRGMNAAIVTRTRFDWDVAAWVGKSWGEPVDAGVQVRKTW